MAAAILSESVAKIRGLGHLYPVSNATDATETNAVGRPTDYKLDGRRTSSKQPELIKLVMAKPLVSAGMVAKTLQVTPQAARRIVLERA